MVTPQQVQLSEQDVHLLQLLGKHHKITQSYVNNLIHPVKQLEIQHHGNPRQHSLVHYFLDHNLNLMGLITNLNHIKSFENSHTRQRSKLRYTRGETGIAVSDALFISRRILRSGHFKSISRTTLKLRVLSCDNLEKLRSWITIISIKMLVMSNSPKRTSK